MSITHDDLVVDDDRMVGKSLGHVPAARGQTVFTAPDAAIALERLGEAEVAMLVTDIRTPVTDGIELAEAVKAGQPRASAPSVADCDNACCEARPRAAGVGALVRKPQSTERIEDSAAKAIAGVPPMPVVAAASAGPAAADAPAPATGVRIRDIALFIAAPLVGLVYLALMPFVGVAALAWFGCRCFCERVRAE